MTDRKFNSVFKTLKFKQHMFTKNDFRYFLYSIFCLTLGSCLMAFDPADNGFGIMTLWIAPPVLLAGFLLPIPGILGKPFSFSLHFLATNKWKNVFGVMVFLTAFATYYLTLEPTASLWDCSEFIASAYKLQVPHTPGTPLSLLIGRIFTMFAFGDVTKVAFTLNLMSGLFSALTVFIVYNFIYFFGKNSSRETGNNSSALLILSAFTGSLCLAFSDTFWFSAVEAETYGAACFFLLLIVWLIIEGKDLKGLMQSRWLVLIFYIAGLGYCIHPMCLLALPILPLTWYLNTRKLTMTNVIGCVLTGLLIVFIINKFIAIGLFELAFSFDLFFVNTIHLPFYSGAITLAILLISLFFLLLQKFKTAAPYTWSIIFLLAGFLPYLILFIRSNQNPPIDETNPEDLSMIKAYMNRESYPSSPLLYGPYFDAQLEFITTKKNIYFQGTGKYELAGTMPAYNFQKTRNTLLPRIYSNDVNHIEEYRRWTGLKENEKPDFGDNLKFMFRYQLGHMYLRYLMFNFVGRENDTQNTSWLKPWDPMHDPARIGSQTEKARNQYWMAPLLFGIFGIVFQYFNNRRNFLSLSIFFLITGLILAIYLNSPPNEPRERDYIYIGSYIAFCIWIGLGVQGLIGFLPKYRITLYLIGSVSILMPFWMLYENYDDHNRSGRTFQIDNARNILNSCASNGILFTGGDNDTFPLWYLQDVEGFRTDVRVMVLSYLNTDWYINQLRKPYYNSPSFKLALDENDYRQYGANDVLYVQESIKQPIDVQQYFKLLKERHPGLTMLSANGEPYHILPSRLLKINLSKEQMLKETFRMVNDTGTIKPSEMILKVTENYLQKNVLAILDLLVSNDWERPIYFNFTSLNGLGLDLEPYMIQEGPVYRLTSARNKEKGIAIDTKTSFENLITKADYSNLKNSNLNFNYEDYQARMIFPARQNFNALAIGFLNEGNKEKASEVIQFAVDHLYLPHLQPSFNNLQACEILLNLGKKKEAASLAKMLFDFCYPGTKQQILKKQPTDNLNVYLLHSSAEILARIGHDEYLEKLNELSISQ